MEGNRGHAQGLAHHAQARRQPAFEQAGAKLHPIGPRHLRRHQAINAFNADFDLERMLAHEWSPIGTVLVVGGAEGGKRIWWPW